MQEEDHEKTGAIKKRGRKEMSEMEEIYVLKDLLGESGGNVPFTEYTKQGIPVTDANMTWQVKSLQGIPQISLPTNISVVSEDWVVWVPLRQIFFRQLLKLTLISNSLVCIFGPAGSVFTATLANASGLNLYVWGETAKQGNPYADYSPQLLEFKLRVNVDNTINNMMQTVNGNVFVGCTDKCSGNLFENIFSTTPLNKNKGQALSFSPVDFELLSDVPSGISYTTWNEAIDASALTTTNSLLIVNPDYASGLSTSLLSVAPPSGTVTTVIMSAATPYYAMPFLDGCATSGMQVVHFVLQYNPTASTVVSAVQLVAVPNLSLPNNYRYRLATAVYVGTYVTLIPGGIWGFSSVSASQQIQLVMKWESVANVRLGVYRGLLGNTLFASGTGKMVVPIGVPLNVFYTIVPPSVKSNTTDWMTAVKANADNDEGKRVTANTYDGLFPRNMPTGK